MIARALFLALLIATVGLLPAVQARAKPQQTLCYPDGDCAGKHAGHRQRGAAAAAAPNAVKPSTQPGDDYAESLSLCKALLSKLVPELKKRFDGYTLVCPTDRAFMEFNEALGYDGDNGHDGVDVEQELEQAAGKYPSLFRQILSYHVVKGVLPKSALKPGLTLKALNGLSLPVTSDEGDLALAVPLVEVDSDDIDKANLDLVGRTDLTFDGAYAPATSKYVVHTVDRVLVPVEVAPAARKAAEAITEFLENEDRRRRRERRRLRRALRLQH